MSLRVWLPLNGTLENKGISNLTFSYSGSNISSNDYGKIGKCYKRTTAAADAIISNSTINLGTNQSMFCWIKMDSFNSGASLTGILGQHRHATYTGMGITLRYASASTGYVSVNTGNGSNRTFNTYYGSTLLNAGTWYHIGYTYDGSNIRIYVNGQLDKTQAFTGMSCPAEYIQIGNWAFSGSSGTGISNYSAPGYINDVRIYDHCLSAAEVREISQGLILHYKLDDPNPNLLKTTPLSYTPANYRGYQISFTENLVANQTYTLQLWDVNVAHSAKTAATLGIDFYWGGGTVKLKSLIGTSYFTNGHADYICTTFTPTSANASGSGATNAWFAVYNSPPSADGTRDMSIGAWKLEKGAVATSWIDSEITPYIQDSSGYEHNGTITGNLIAASGSPRYNNAITFNGSTSYFDYNHITANDQTLSEFTFATWIKRTYTDATARHFFYGPIRVYLYTDFKVRLTWTAQEADSSYATNTWATGQLISADTWTHIALTFKNSIMTVYINGVSKSTNSRPPYVRGYQGTSGSIGSQFIGDLSDTRFYTTALSDNDILSLYNTGAKIDNLQNLHTFEYVENSSNIKLTKAGQLKEGEIEEDTTTKFYKTNKIIKAKQFIER